MAAFGAQERTAISMSVITSRYARAFVDVVVEGRLNAEKVLNELIEIQRTWRESPDLRRVWESPAIPPEQKRALLDAIAARESVSRPVRNFVAVLIDHRRIPLLDQVVTDFQRELNNRLGFAEAEVTSARELNEGERRALEAQVGKLVGKNVMASYSRDESILGGAIIKVGSTIYDGSVKGQLERIREQLAEG
jgi:F-type H+-transporting ATPase subunit delta